VGSKSEADARVALMKRSILVIPWLISGEVQRARVNLWKALTPVTLSVRASMRFASHASRTIFAAWPVNAESLCYRWSKAFLEAGSPAIILAKTPFSLHRFQQV
jgi:hypothetical protein